MKIKRNDQVTVIAGEDKGKSGRVLRVIPDQDRVVVEGVNFIKRHTRPRPGQQGGIIEREAPIHVSNVMVNDPADGKPSRIGSHVLADGKRQRVARRSGEALPDNEA
ncbi:MAG: 50S ribosomal protein L24 [bacterium]